jgi:hypothetical protein
MSSFSCLPDSALPSPLQFTLCPPLWSGASTSFRFFGTQANSSGRIVMSVPWLGVQKIAVVPTFNTQFDGPAPPDWDYLVMRRVLYDPDPVTGADRSLRAYINALSYGQAVLNAQLFPHAFSEGPSVMEAAWQSLPSGHDCPYVLCVIPWADGDANRIGYFEGVGQNGVLAVARVAMYDILAIKHRQTTGVWAMEVLHAMIGWPDLYKAHGTNMGDWDNMTFNAGTHSCAHLKLHPGWLAATDIANHPGRERDYDLQSLSVMRPSPGRFAAVRIRSTTGNVFMAEARLRSDVYEMGFAPLTGEGGNEFRGLPGSGVIVYQTHDDLQETLFVAGGLRAEQTYDDAGEGFSIRVLAAIDEGVSVRVTGGAIAWNHNDLTDATDAPSAVGDPAGYKWDVDKTQHVVFRSRNGHIDELWFSLGGGWGHNDLMQEPGVAGASNAGGDPAGYTWDVDSTQHVVYRGTDGHIHELWFSLGGGWSHNDLMQQPGVVGATDAVSDPAGYTWDVDKTQHVIYRGTDGHIHELWFSLGGGWSHKDLMQEPGVAGAPNAVGDPAGYTWDVDSTQHVTYRGTDGHIHELWFSLGGGGWSHKDLMQEPGIAGASNAGGDPAGYTWDVDSTQHVIYRGTDGHIHELWFSLGGGWGHNDLMQEPAVVGTPNAVGDPAGYTWDVDKTQHVVYHGTDGHIHELWFSLGGGWSHSDLMQQPGVTGASNAVGDPAGYTWDVDSTQHVVYRGTDGHIHELWF